jgi:hypothetical protein
MQRNVSHGKKHLIFKCAGINFVAVKQIAKRPPCICPVNFFQLLSMFQILKRFGTVKLKKLITL